MSNALDHSPAAVIQQMLIDLSLATDPVNNGAWPVFVSNEMDTPDSCITIYDTDGLLEGRIQVSGQVIEKPGLQFRFRAARPDTCFVKANAVMVAMEGSVNLLSVTISTSNYLVHAIDRVGSLISLGREADVSNRHIYVFNATVTLNKV